MADGYNDLNPIRGFEIENQNYKIDYDRGINLPVGVRNESIDARGRLNNHGEIFNEREVFPRDLGNYSHTEGFNTISEGEQSTPQAYGYASHVEGIRTNTSSNAKGAHAEGILTNARGEGSHAEGNNNDIELREIDLYGAFGDGSHAEGSLTKAKGNYSHAEGLGSAAGIDKNKGVASHAEGEGAALGDYSHAEGMETTANGLSSHAEGSGSFANGTASHAEGQDTQANGSSSHAEGSENSANGIAAHAEGSRNFANGIASHAEGQNTKAEGTGSHAEGIPTSNMLPQGEPNQTVAKGAGAHAEGACCHAFGDASHAQGTNCEADGFASFASGAYVVNRKEYTAALGYGLSTSEGMPQGGFVIGAFNDPQDGIMFTIGGGNSDNVQLTEAERQACINRAETEGRPEFADMYQKQLKTWLGMYRNRSGITRKNIFTVLQNGKVYITNNLYVGSEQTPCKVYANAFETVGSAADYAEYFLWDDGNLNQEIRQQKFVSLVEDKIKIAEPGEDIIGIISTEPIVLGDGKLIANKNEYEYAPVGLLGKLIVEDNGECKVGSRCTCGHGGIAIPGSDYRVIKRLDNNHILVLASFL